MVVNTRKIQLALAAAAVLLTGSLAGCTPNGNGVNAAGNENEGNKAGADASTPGNANKGTAENEGASQTRSFTYGWRRATMDFLKVEGRRIVDGRGREVRLRGFSFASWLNWENFILGMPGHETGVRQALVSVLGAERAEHFFTSFLNHFIQADDFRFIRSLGCNLVRIPFNYRHFESDEAPYGYLPEGFAWLDQAVGWARDNGIYVILDMHAAQGGQNPNFHSDTITGHAAFWDHQSHRDRASALWREIARRYRDEPAIAGYDLLNEPIPPHISQLNRFYLEAVRAIREVDERHIVFIEGDGYATRFDELDPPFDENAVYSMHYYSACGMGNTEYPGTDPHSGRYWDREALKREYIERSAFMRKHGVPNWFGETSVTFPASVSQASRMRFLEDTLSIAEEQGDSWTFGIYKDLGKTGIVHVDPASEWVRRTAPVSRAIDALHCNPFADHADENDWIALCRKLGNHIHQTIGGLDGSASAEELNRTVLFRLSECIAPVQLQIPFARQFSALSEAEIDGMMQSFLLRNCRRHEGWADIVRRTTGADAQ
ncbi:cellulase family glycosylhydrolase [Paenibacillus sp. MWE-103]|uniref:Cellulase family glycosylhydrolase n=1 Tax=Paenibacillus artemisiicola TaxID=1172618 RepID=A0ABS3W5U7_9BACL|nr:cellulase family glycosylhydrolase [Paenibacillus artemisiicola]MBO7743685.1 cellulase family glycosylhydrolase [Paenibacillus artemisiicola]